MATIKGTDALLFVLIFAALVVRGLLSPPIWHHDGEAREGLVVQGIVQTQEWTLPFRNGELPSKPPLFHWIAAVPSLLVGLSDFTVRLPSVIGAGIMALTTFLMGRMAGGRRTAFAARAIGVAILLFDVTLVVMSRDVWRDVTLEKSRLAFANEISAILPGNMPLFAAPDLDDTALIVIAYRLGREIRRKPINCGDTNDYFLSPAEFTQGAGSASRTLALSKNDNIVLVTLLSGSRVRRNSDCMRSSPGRYGEN